MVITVYAAAEPASVPSASPLRFVAPCVPVAAAVPPAGDAWLHEAKLDGYRAQIIKQGRTLVSTCQAFPSRQAILDGELCLPDVVLGVAMLAAFVLLLRLGLPHADGSPSLIARNEHVTSAYTALLVGLLMGAIRLIFTSLLG